MNSFLYKKNKYDIQSYRYIRKYYCNIKTISIIRKKTFCSYSEGTHKYHLNMLYDIYPLKDTLSKHMKAEKISEIMSGIFMSQKFTTERINFLKNNMGDLNHICAVLMYLFTVERISVIHLGSIKLLMKILYEAPSYLYDNSIFDAFIGFCMSYNSNWILFKYLKIKISSGIIKLLCELPLIYGHNIIAKYFKIKTKDVEKDIRYHIYIDHQFAKEYLMDRKIIVTKRNEDDTFLCKYIKKYKN